MTKLQEQVKKAFCTKNCSDLSLFEQIVPVISIFFLAEDESNFGNKYHFKSNLETTCIQGAHYLIIDIFF